MRTALGEGGRLVIPATMRRAMDLKPGDQVELRLDGDELRIVAAHQTLRRAQELLRRRIPAGRSLAGELIADRRREAKGG